MRSLQLKLIKIGARVVRQVVSRGWWKLFGGVISG